MMNVIMRARQVWSYPAIEGKGHRYVRLGKALMLNWKEDYFLLGYNDTHSWHHNWAGQSFANARLPQSARSIVGFKLRPYHVTNLYSEHSWTIQSISEISLNIYLHLQATVSINK